jgi:heme/copper-type cytochrome/quinol oxidase subunit 2
MKNWKLIGKIATYFTYTAAIITIVLTIITYFTLQITYSQPPIEYVTFIILQTIMPYLLVTILSAIVAVMSKGALAPEEPQEESGETPEDEALPPAVPAEDNA